MCLIAAAWGLHPRYPLVLAANRDEFHDRPSTPMDWWADGQTLAGRDLQAGGTWLGLNREGRVGVLTNVREPGRQSADAASRGHIISRWLEPSTEIGGLQDQLQTARHNGYNLLALDLARGEMHWTSNRHGHRHRLGRGLYGLSNAALDTAWPKLERLKALLAQALEPTTHSSSTTAAELLERLHHGLQDRHQPADDELPRTGISWEWEQHLARIFIQTPDGRYGTRCSTVIVVEATHEDRGTVHVQEQTWSPKAEPAGVTRHQFECSLHRMAR